MREVDRVVVLIPAGFERGPQFSVPELGTSVWLRWSQPGKGERVCCSLRGRDCLITRGPEKGGGGLKPMFSHQLDFTPRKPAFPAFVTLDSLRLACGLLLSPQGPGALKIARRRGSKDGVAQTLRLGYRCSVCSSGITTPPTLL